MDLAVITAQQVAELFILIGWGLLVPRPACSAPRASRLSRTCWSTSSFRP